MDSATEIQELSVWPPGIARHANTRFRKALLGRTVVLTQAWLPAQGHSETPPPQPAEIDTAGQSPRQNQKPQKGRRSKSCFRLPRLLGGHQGASPTNTSRREIQRSSLGLWPAQHQRGRKQHGTRGQLGKMSPERELWSVGSRPTREG
jgi:hypothetical protein